MLKRWLRGIGLLISVLALAGCAGSEPAGPVDAAATQEVSTQTPGEPTATDPFDYFAPTLTAVAARTAVPPAPRSQVEVVASLTAVCEEAVIFPVYGKQAGYPDIAGRPGAWRVIYQSTPEDWRGHWLLSAPIEGGEVLRLTEHLIYWQGVWVELPIEISVDGETIFYLAEDEAEDLNSLYRASVYEGDPQLLAAQAGWSLTLNPFNERVYFDVYLEHPSPGYLASVSMEGGEVVPVAEEQSGAAVVGYPGLTPDGRYLLGGVRDEEHGEIRLFSLPLAGGERVPLGPDHDQNVLGGMPLHLISPDGRFYVGMFADNGELNTGLYAARLDTGPYWRLDQALPAGTMIADYVISADSQQVIFRAAASMDDKVILYSAPIGGGVLRQLSPDGLDVQAMAVSPRSDRVVYLALDEGRPRMFAADLAGENILPLDPLAQMIDPYGGGVWAQSPGLMRYTSNGDALLFVASGDLSGHLLRLDPYSGALLDLTASLDRQADQYSFTISPDDRWVAFTANDGDVYLTSIEGGEPVRIADGQGAEAIWTGVQFTPDSQWLVFEAGGAVGAAPVSCAAP